MRTPLQQLMRKANDILRYAENNRLETDKLATIKNALEQLNAHIDKRGRQDRFADKIIKDEQLAGIYEGLARDLIENANLPQIFKNPKWKKYGMDKQDYLDMVDKSQEIKVHTLESYGLSSEQIHDIYSLTRGAGWNNERVEEIIKAGLMQAIAEQKVKGFTEINPDRLSNFIKDEIYKNMALDEVHAVSFKDY